MSILVDRTSRVIIQGITGAAAARHAGIMLECGTRLVGGVAPGRGGQRVEGLPVFDTVREAVALVGADVSLIFLSAAHVRDAILEAAANGIGTIVCITEGVPVCDMLLVAQRLRGSASRLIGPNCPGIISPGRAKVGIMPASAFQPGRVGVISRSGTLGYEISRGLSQACYGQSTFVGIGGDPLTGSTFEGLMPLFEADPETDAVVIAGEIGGGAEEAAARYVAAHMRKPVVAFIAGREAPPEQRMGHAGAIISGEVGSWAAKAAALTEAGIPLADSPFEIPALLRERGVPPAR